MNRIIDKDQFQSLGSVASSIVNGLACANGERIYDGEVISEPGIYRNMPMEAYHSDCCAGPSISSGGLRQLTPPNGCPMQYWDASYLNPNRAPEEQKEHLNLGKAVHSLLLSEDGFRDKYVVRDKKWTNWTTKESKEWRDAQVKAGKVVLVPDDLTNIQGMAERIAKDRTFTDLLMGRVERSIIWKDAKTGVWLKSRPDTIPEDGFIADLKTTTDASDIGCQRSTLSFGYHIQIGLACMGLEEVTQRPVTDHVLLFIETKRPWAYNIKPLDNQFVYAGMRQARAGINIFAECWRTGNWPTYFGSGITLVTPDWFDKQIDREPAIPQEAA